MLVFPCLPESTMWTPMQIVMVTSSNNFWKRQRNISLRSQTSIWVLIVQMKTMWSVECEKFLVYYYVRLRGHMKNLQYVFHPNSSKHIERIKLLGLRLRAFSSFSMFWAHCETRSHSFLLYVYIPWKPDTTQLFTTSNFIGPWYHAALLFSGLGSKTKYI